MKNNDEFLKGVYEKIEILSKDKTNKFKYRKYVKYSSIAALFIIIPLLLLQNNIGTHEPSVINEPRILSMGNIESDLANSEYVILGVITSKAKSEEGLNVQVEVEEVLYGENIKDTLVVSTLSDLDEVFRKDTRVVLLLDKVEEDFVLFSEMESILVEETKGEFLDIFGNKYSIKEINNIIDRSR